MRLLLFFLLSLSILHAKAKDTCYTVQLKSFKLKQNSHYNFQSKSYPDSCKLITFTNINTIRCGCYHKRSLAKEQEKKLQKTYKNALVVRTYKYRFADEISLAKQVEKEKVKTQELQKAQQEKKQEEIKEAEQTSEENKEISQTEEVSQTEDVLVTSTFLDKITTQGNVDFTSQFYLKKPDDKQKNNFTASAELELAYNEDDFKIMANIKAQQDYYDFDKKDETGRSFIRLDELLLQYDLENDQLKLGKTIEFWGALEVRNITDGFNPVDLRSDPFEVDKLGVWSGSFTHYTDTGELSFIVKFEEQSRDMAKFPYVYYYFPKDVQVPFLGAIPLEYQNKLHTEDGDMRPTYYLKYSGSTETDYPLDYAIIIQNGYDSQRYYSTDYNPATNIVDAYENAYLVNKIITYNTLVVDSTLYKLEATYTDVVHSKENNVSDYMHLGLGLEHTLTQVYGEADLGLIAEYYYYHTFDSNKKTDLDLFELFQNDLFMGIRYSFNEGNDASIVTGAIIDLEYDEQVYYFEYESRIADTIKLNFDYRYINPSSHDLTAFHLMGTHERLSLKLGYYF